LHVLHLRRPALKGMTAQGNIRSQGQDTIERP
jgi:hypothetical protein